MNAASERTMGDIVVASEPLRHLENQSDEQHHGQPDQHDDHRNAQRQEDHLQQRDERVEYHHATCSPTRRTPWGSRCARS